MIFGSAKYQLKANTEIGLFQVQTYLNPGCRAVDTLQTVPERKIAEWSVHLLPGFTSMMFVSLEEPGRRQFLSNLRFYIFFGSLGLDFGWIPEFTHLVRS